ncbi:bifunctional pyr operon transcriptional regulator/uracil phosphoribosyltransferase PyrR [filamentous cyanobacterium LEGE 11480]|uniref:Bifunctional protein PyrR n=1 Tax=Romeriopsis navalis LEGE 11480 TaxID=2777977 RepID=A0A928VWB3_9CYAN|nr:bifunctional pyr operon transcriptional regulator/uracil phosphoribosyltransferase PyrR [Romeriopsis navalis]MBE9033219.1 bifunctional pyr operon transcriptional regulator/uracil phosphoribosyltransferase PyrR [Romeriopsis navalis LEGE 11480]
MAQAAPIEILSQQEVRRTFTRLACQIIERANNLSDLVLLGIQTRGVPIAQILAKQIQQLETVEIPVGAIDITFYRDDLDSIGARTPGKTNIPTDLNGKTVVLVDDVIYTGRTIRAAMDAIVDYGRPDTIRLAVMIDRGHRQLPIQPDFVGKVVPTTREENIQVALQEIDGREGVELLKPNATN